MADADVERLTARLEQALVDPANGNIRAYRICADCIGAAFGIGTVAETLSSRACTVV